MSKFKKLENRREKHFITGILNRFSLSFGSKEERVLVDLSSLTDSTQHECSGVQWNVLYLERTKVNRHTVLPAYHSKSSRCVILSLHRDEKGTKNSEDLRLTYIDFYTALAGETARETILA